LLSIINSTHVRLQTKAAGKYVGSFFICFLLTACATAPQTQQLLAHNTLEPVVQLQQVPFIPQQQYQCGPASLAMMLRFRGSDVSAEQLIPEVYLPERKGSLQIEMLASARHHHQIPYVIKPRMEDLLREIAAGNPVLVLLNLGLQWAPRWHYAVVIGYDLNQRLITLHSGSEAEHRMTLTTFERTWQRADHWGVVIAAPGQVPVSASPRHFIDAVTALQGDSEFDIRLRHKAYLAAVRAWPTVLLPQLALGNSYYRQGDLVAAERSFRTALHYHPDSVLALNNLAQTLADQQRLDEALAVIQRAVAQGGPYASLVRETQRAIEQQQTQSQERRPPPRH
jgi:tetratricopeptide (TPR) repeat protein